MTSPTTVSLSSVLKRTGRSIETILSAVDIVDDGIAVATNYMARIREEQMKESKQKILEFDQQLLLRKASAMNEFKAGAYQIGNKSRQLQALPEYEDNVAAFEQLIK